MVAPLLQQNKKEVTKKPAKSWHSEGSKKQYSLLDFMKFTFPFLWKGGYIVKTCTVLTFVLLVLTKVLNVIHPLILKEVIDAVTSTNYGDEMQRHTYFLIGMYTLTMFSADFVNYIREVPFATVSASAETYIAHMVYNHI